MTHEDRLLDYLRKHRYIFPLAAIQKLGNTRLADTVHKLRRHGYNIRTDMVPLTNRWGDTCRVAKYVYLESPKAKRLNAMREEK